MSKNPGIGNERFDFMTGDRGLVNSEPEPKKNMESPDVNRNLDVVSDGNGSDELSAGSATSARIGKRNFFA